MNFNLDIHNLYLTFVLGLDLPGCYSKLDCGQSHKRSHQTQPNAIHLSKLSEQYVALRGALAVTILLISQKKSSHWKKKSWREGWNSAHLITISIILPAPKIFFCSMYTWPFICSIIINVQLQIFIQSDIWMVECLMWMNWWKKNNLNEASFSNHKTFYPALLGLSNVGMNLTLSGQASFMLHSTFVMLFFSQMRSNILGWSDNSCVVLNFSAENVRLPPTPLLLTIQWFPEAFTFLSNSKNPKQHKM